MNTENLKLLRAAIAESETYSQEDFFHPCGTPACLAGHAAMLADVMCPPAAAAAVRRAEAWLDLTVEEGDAMFDPHPLGCYVTPKEDALAMLDRAIETDKVLWSMRY